VKVELHEAIVAFCKAAEARQAGMGDVDMQRMS